MADLLDPAVLRSEPGIDALAAAVREEFQKAQAALANGVSHSMNAGDALIAARHKVGRGWQKWVQEACGLALSTAKLCVQLAQHRAEIEAAIRDGAELSLRGARRLITKSFGKSKKPKPVETLEAHWKRATTKDRTAFLDSIGVAAVLESMSADFGRDLRSRVPAPKSEQTSGPTLLAHTRKNRAATLLTGRHQ
jgi:hypothetical protein